MKGQLITIAPAFNGHTCVTTLAPLDSLPSLDMLQAAVGGNIETVPYFDRISIDGKQRKCVAFCNEEGKLHGLPVNSVATTMWAIYAHDHGVIKLNDVLCGPVVIVTGDNELLEAL